MTPKPPVLAPLEPGTAPGRARRPRPPGRPAGNEGASRDALVDAALHSFASRGYVASTLRDIARTARVTPALANYYFGGKEGLLSAVVESRVQPLVSKLGEALAAAGDDPLGAIEAFLQAYTRLALDSPWVPRLVVREVLGESGGLRETFARRFAGGVSAALGERIRVAQARGLIDAGLDPAAVVLSLLSLCIFPIISAPVIPGVLGVRLAPETAPALAAHHLRVFLRGVGAKP